ncbi:MAG: exonuclease domain-containing protein [Faecalibacterium sp.]|nr:exonuclease domain-containing protein [Ruminococcus sp.]MCM1392906.1 exonuclease domain-containing protein [Ruminococcus sp.]MCM1485312.1 exonuclease domain-containing protein [Faecalibacterium sp.]
MTEKYISFDLEMPSNISRISAIGITVVENGEVTESFYSLVNPETAFDPFIVKLIGITPDMVADKPTFPEIWEKVREMMSDGILAAYNATSDLKVLCECLKSYGIEWEPTVKYLCTYEMGLVSYPQLDGHTLDKLCEHVGIDLEHHHAGSDSYGCAMLLVDYIKNGMKVEDYVKIYDVQRCRRRISKKTFEEKYLKKLMSYGTEKHKMKTLAKFPYLEPDCVVGVEEKNLHKLSFMLCKSNRAIDFIRNYPHTYYDENNLHAILISKKKKFSSCVALIDEFIPFINSVETCDYIRPGIFEKKQPELKDVILRWLNSGDKYGMIIGFNILNRYYVETEFLDEFLDYVSQFKCKSAAVKSRIVRFFLLSLEYDFDKTYPYLISGRLSKNVLDKIVSVALKGEGLSGEHRTLIEDVMKIIRNEEHAVAQK